VTPTAGKGDGGATPRKAERLLDLARTLAAEDPTFLERKGAGVGDKATAAFMGELRRRATSSFGSDHAEQTICGTNKFCVDYYFRDEATIVEVAMSLRNPTSEFERDILKAMMAQDDGQPVRRLVFISKPGAAKRPAAPSSRAIIEWAARAHDLTISVHEIVAGCALRESVRSGQ
jgi:hypothetical protein